MSHVSAKTHYLMLPLWWHFQRLHRYNLKPSPGKAHIGATHAGFLGGHCATTSTTSTSDPSSTMTTNPCPGWLGFWARCTRAQSSPSLTSTPPSARMCATQTIPLTTFCTPTQLFEFFAHVAGRPQRRQVLSKSGFQLLIHTASTFFCTKLADPVGARNDGLSAWGHQEGERHYTFVQVRVGCAEHTSIITKNI